MDATRSWYDSITEALIQLNGVKSSVENAMFMWYDSNNILIGHLVTHVDDLTYAGSEEWRRIVIQTLQDRFKIRDHYESVFMYLGLNIVQCDGEIIIDQHRSRSE